MGKKYLVTGATGFVGSHLARRLVQNNDDVHVFTRPQSNKWRIGDIINSINDHQVDLTNGPETEKAISQIRPDVIYHCAAYGVCPGQHDVIRSGEVNTMGTINLVEALMKIGSYQCMINTGSSAEYGRKSKPITENDSFEPNTAYGATKAGAALFCEAMARAKDQPIINLKLMSPYGPYDELNRLVPAVIKKCLAGQDPELSTGIESRSFFFMDDLIDLYMIIPDSKWNPGEVVIAGPNEQYSVRDIATRIIRLTGANVQPLFSALPPREFDTDYWIADITKVNKLFGWTPRVDIDEGLRRTIEWYRTSEVCKQN